MMGKKLSTLYVPMYTVNLFLIRNTFITEKCSQYELIRSKCK